MKFLILALFPFLMTFTNEVSPSFITLSSSESACFSGGDLYTINLKIEPESSEKFSRKFDERKTITVQIAGGDLGSGRIVADVYDPKVDKISSGDLGSGRIVAEVYDPKGNKVASGSSEVSFNTKNVKGNYKIVLINKTKNLQKVKVSINQSDS